MLKIFLGGCIIAFASMLGRVFANKYKRKRDFYIALEAFLQHLKREISFSNQSLFSIISTANIDNEDLSEYLSLFCRGEVVLPDFLQESERLMITSFFQKVGHCDRLNEVELSLQFYKEIKALREEESRRCDKYVGLSSRLGFFIGSIIFVVII